METKIQNKMKTIVVTTINGVDILASAEDDELVPVKPLCDLFGIASNKQIEKLTSNPLYSSTGTLRVSVAADKKDREMYCLPVEYLFAWMLGINSANVKKEIREKLLEYQKDCVQALKEHFFGKYRKRAKTFEDSARLEAEKQKLIDNENKSEDLARLLDIDSELKKLRQERSRESRETFSGMMKIFSEKEMSGK
jgi:hypothetical protein